jgi:hypothetical protein
LIFIRIPTFPKRVGKVSYGTHINWFSGARRRKHLIGNQGFIKNWPFSPILFGCAEFEAYERLKLVLPRKQPANADALTAD